MLAMFGNRIRPLLAITLLVAATDAAAQPTPDGEREQPTPATEKRGALPEVSDAMLKPIPPAKRTVRSWREALKIVRARSTALRSSLGRIEAASGRARQSLAAALPTLSARGQLNHHLIVADFAQIPGLPPQFAPQTTPYSASLSLRQPVLSLSAWYSVGTAKAAKKVAELNAKEAQRIVLGSVAEAIVNVITSERIAEVRRVALKSALSTHQLTRRRAQLGGATAADVLRAQQEIALTRAAIITADESVRRSREALGLLLGYSEGWGVPPSIKLDTLAKDAEASCKPVKSVLARPDVRAAKASVSLAERNLRSVDYQYAPTLDFVSDLNYFSIQNQISQERYTWTIGAVFSWTIYDGGARGGNSDALSGDLAVAKSDFTEAKRRARLEVKQAKRGIKVAAATLRVTQKTRQLAEKTARLSRISFLNGNGNSFNLVDAARRVREADIDVAIKEFELVRAKITALLALSECDV